MALPPPLSDLNLFVSTEFFRAKVLTGKMLLIGMLKSHAAVMNVRRAQHKKAGADKFTTQSKCMALTEKVPKQKTNQLREVPTQQSFADQLLASQATSIHPATSPSLPTIQHRKSITGHIFVLAFHHFASPSLQLLSSPFYYFPLRSTYRYLYESKKPSPLDICHMISQPNMTLLPCFSPASARPTFCKARREPVQMRQEWCPQAGFNAPLCPFLNGSSSCLFLIFHCGKLRVLMLGKM